MLLASLLSPRSCWPCSTLTAEARYQPGIFSDHRLTVLWPRFIPPNSVVVPFFFRYSEGEIRFNLMAIISDRRAMYQKQLEQLQARAQVGVMIQRWMLLLSCHKMKAM